MRTRGARAVGAGLADQVVIALANAGNSLLAVLLVPDRERAGVLVLSLVIGYVVLSLNRAFVGEVLLALAARFDDERRARLVRDGLTTALAFGAAAALVLTAIWALVARPGGIALPDLIWVALVIPVVLVHDTARFSHLAGREQSRALAIDLTFVLTQGAAVLALALSGLITPGRLVLCWGLGAAAGLALFVARTGQVPWRGDPRRWLTQTRFLSGWFIATAVIGQLQILAVNFTIGLRLSERAVAGFRLVQTVVLQPVQNFNQALMALLVPRMSGLAGESSKPALRRYVRRGAALLAGLAVALLAVGGLLTQWLLPLVPDYADTAPVAWPLLLQGAIYMVQAPFTSALRGMHRGAMQLLQYAVFTTASLVGLVIGSGHSLLGAAWGLAAGSVVGLVATVSLYVYALGRPAPATSEYTLSS